MHNRALSYGITQLADASTEPRTPHALRNLPVSWVGFPKEQGWGAGRGQAAGREDAEKGLEQESTGQVGEGEEQGWSVGATTWGRQYLSHSAQHPRGPHSRDPDSALQKF